MPDTARHGAPLPDPFEARHTLTVREVEVLLANAGVQRSHRHVLRLCQAGTLDAVKIPGGPSGEEWYVAPPSVPKAIGDLKQIDAQRARRDTLRPAVSEDDAADKASKIDQDTARHGAPQHGTSSSQAIDEKGETQHAMPRHVVPEPDIFNHPYVKRLEDRVDKAEQKYEAQVRRTEEIQMKNQEQLVELQRMTAVGNSETLANFMLKAKDWIFNDRGIETGKGEGPSEL